MFKKYSILSVVFMIAITNVSLANDCKKKIENCEKDLDVKINECINDSKSNLSNLEAGPDTYQQRVHYNQMINNGCKENFTKEICSKACQ